MLQEHVQPFLERLSASMVEHVLGLELLVDGQCDGVVRVGHSSGHDHLLLLVILLPQVFVIVVIAWNACRP